MILIGDKLFFIIDKDDACARAMRDADSQHIELEYFDIKTVIYTKKFPDFNKYSLEEKLNCRESKAGRWRISLESAEVLFNGKGQWICPD